MEGFRIQNVAIFLFVVPVAFAQSTYTWDGGAATSNWTDAANWNPDGVPGNTAGDSATIDSGVTVTISAALSNPLASLSVSGNSFLVITGSGFTVNVTSGSGTISVGGASGGTITIDDDEGPSSLITVSCKALTVAANGVIESNGRGFAGGAAGTDGSGPGGGKKSISGSVAGGGGAYGGDGGFGVSTDGTNGVGGTAYGSVSNPTDPGSGGGGYTSSAGAAGGGRIRLVVSGQLTVDGSVQCNGVTNNSSAGNGSGGSIFITAGSVTGAGTVQADGGSGSGNGGAGGGGRLSITGFTGTVSPALSAKGGVGVGGAQSGGAGSIYLLPSGQTNPDIKFDNGGVSGAATAPFPTSIGTVNSLTIGTNLTLVISSAFTVISGTTTVPSGSTLVFNGGGYTITQQVGIVIASGGTIFVDDDNGASSLITISTPSLNVQSGGVLHANGAGFAGGATGVDGSGPGGGKKSISGSVAGGGGAYGGDGGFGVSTDGSNGVGGTSYGVIDAPTLHGSGGGGFASYGGAAGGGRLRMVVSGQFTVDGSIQCNGATGNNSAGNGSGGSIYISANTVAGSGIIQANGGSGSGNGGPGGGGRIAITGFSGTIAPTVEAKGGLGSGNAQAAGGAGSVYLLPQGAVNPDVRFGNSINTADGASSGFPASLSTVNSLTFGTGVQLYVNGALTVVTGTTTIPSGTTVRLNGSGYTLQHNGTLSVASGGSIFVDDDNGASSLIVINAATLTVQAGGMIHANGAGFAGGTTATDGSGPGGGKKSTSGSIAGGGGAYGGNGGFGVSTDGTNGVGGISYGSFSNPTELGSGGGGFASYGGAPGGGRIRIIVGSTLTVDGSIQCNGATGSNSAGNGSGGSIYITAPTVNGTGFVQANGASGGNGGGGGGGRIAIAGFTGIIFPTLSAKGGAGVAGGQTGGAGSIFALASGATSGDVTIDNAGASGADTDIPDGSYTFNLMTVSGGAVVVQSIADKFKINGTLDLSSTWTHTSGSANSVRIEAANMSISGAGIIDVRGRGFAATTGPGVGADGTGSFAANGGGHGGSGGVGILNASAGGATYGSASAPVDPGSGGGNYGGSAGGAGGGVVRLNISGTLTVNGNILANGSPGNGAGGGGAGGSIFIIANTITGLATGAIEANGEIATSNGGPGGGGRVAIYSNNNTYAGTALASGQAGGGGATASSDGVVFVLPADSLISNDSPAEGALVSTATVTWSGFTLPGGGTFKVYLDDDEHLGNGEPTANHPETGMAMKTISTASNTATFSGVTSGTLFWQVVAFDSGNNIVGASRISSFFMPVSFTWDGGAATTNWNDAANWNPDGIPGTTLGDSVLINSAVTVNLPGAPANALSALTVQGGGTLQLSGVSFTMNVSDSAGSVTVGGASAGTIIFNDDKSAAAAMRIQCNSLTVNSNGTIHADGKGYAGSSGSGNGSGPGGGFGNNTTASGAGHGGQGGKSGNGTAGGAQYDSITAPSLPGSGGAANDTGAAGSGGGRIRLEVSGQMQVDGTISANGTVGAAQTGGSSGGSIYITAGTVVGTGTVRAEGSAGGANNNSEFAGGGAGGIIAIDGFSSISALVLSAKGGGPTAAPAEAGAAGTIYVKPSSANADLTIDNASSVTSSMTSVGSLTLNNATISGNSRVRLTASAPSLSLTGNLTLGSCNVIMASNGQLLVAGSVSISASKTVRIDPYNGTDGGHFVLSCSSMTIDGTIDGNGSGFAGASVNGAGQGPGAGSGNATATSGAGHGGIGGFGNTGIAGGAAYDSILAPSEMGSGGGAQDTGAAGRGGGRVRLQVSGNLALNGSINVNATVGGAQSGGSSGGSVYITAGSVTGIGIIGASGSSGGSNNNSEPAGGGAGGRIAIDGYSTISSLGLTAKGGSQTSGFTNAQAGGAGTIYLAPSSGNPDLIINNGGLFGATTPVSAGFTLANFTVDGGANFDMTVNSLNFSTFGTFTLGDGTFHITPSSSLSVNGNFTIGNMTVRMASTSSIVGTGDVTLPTAKTLTLATYNGTDGGQLILNCASMTIDGTIDGSGSGFAGGTINSSGQGPGAGAGNATATSGAGHGGIGGFGNTGIAGGAAYDSIIAPAEMGSGGGAQDTGAAGRGGGRVRLQISGNLGLNGSINVSATGGGSQSGGSSGGSVYLTAGSLSGTGSINANGSAGGSNNNSEPAGGGAGGRIAIDGFTTIGSLTVSAKGGSQTTGFSNAQPGGAGTIFVKPASANGDLTLDNGGLSGGITPVSFLNLNNATLTGSARADFSGSPQTLNLAGNLTFGNFGLMMDPAARITVAGNTTLSSGATLRLEKFNGTRGGILFIESGSITIDGTIDGIGQGFNGSAGSGNGSGPGGGQGNNTSAAGGGHGGAGGNGASTTGGSAYGSLTAPIDMGSGGGANDTGAAGSGGGRVRLHSTSAFALNGTINVSGSFGAAQSGGSAGGSVYITAGSFSGTGTVTVNGSNGGVNSNSEPGGGGSGGRVSIFAGSSTFSGAINANGGTPTFAPATSGGPGVITFPTSPSLISLDSPASGSVGTGTVSWSGFTLPVGGTFKVYLDDDEHLGNGEPTTNHPETGEAMQTSATTANSTTFGSLTGGKTYFWHVAALDSGNNVVAASAISRFVFTNAPNLPATLGQFKSDAVTVIPTGGFVTDTQFVLKATGSDPDPADTFKLQFELRLITDAFTSPGIVSIDNINFFETGFSASNAAQELAKTISLSNGVKIHWQVRTVDSGGSGSIWVPYPDGVPNNDVPTADIDFAIDSTAPTPGAVSDGTGADVDLQSSTTTIAANWSGFLDSESGISFFEWAIGTTPGGSDVQSFVNVGSSTSASNSALSLSGGQTYFVTVRATNGAGLSTTATSDGVLVDATSPNPGTVNDGTGADIDSQTDTTTISANWSGFSDTESGISFFEWAIGSSPGGTDVLNFTAVGLATSATQSGLTLVNNTTYYVTVRATNGAGGSTAVSSDGVLVSGDTTPPIAGAVSDGVAADIDFQTSTSTISANWSGFSDPESGITGFEWAIGTTSGGTNVQLFISVGLVTSATNSALTLTQGTTYFVSVRATNSLSLQTTVTSDGVTVDTTAPTPGTVRDGVAGDIDFQKSGTTLAANWPGFNDAQSSVVKYEIGVGTTPGATDVQAFTNVGTATSGSQSGFTLTNGVTYFVTVRATNGAGLQTTATSDGVMVDLVAPTAPGSLAANPNPNSGDFILTWTASTDTPSGLDHYEIYYQVGTGPIQLLDNSVSPTATSKTVVDFVGGNVDISIIAVDKAGNNSAASNVVTVVVVKPTVYFVYPRGLSTAGGTIDIFGKNFNINTGGVVVSQFPSGFSTVVPSNLVDSTRITALVPEGPASSWSVDVTNKNGSNDVAQSAFTICASGNFNLQLTGGSTVDAYRMVSIPAFMGPQKFVGSLFQKYGFYDIRIWRIFRWNPAKSAYEEFTEISEQMLLDCAGYSFWVISRVDADVPFENVLSTSSAEFIYVPIEPGWNQIANPFGSAVMWGDVRVGTTLATSVKVSTLTPGGVQPILKFAAFWNKGGYFLVNDSDLLLPNAGYFVYNGSSTRQILYFQKPVFAKPGETQEYTKPFDASVQPPSPPGNESASSPDSGAKSHSGGCFVSSNPGNSLTGFLFLYLAILVIAHKRAARRHWFNRFYII